MATWDSPTKRWPPARSMATEAAANASVNKNALSSRMAARASTNATASAKPNSLLDGTKWMATINNPPVQSASSTPAWNKCLRKINHSATTSKVTPAPNKAQGFKTISKAAAERPHAAKPSTKNAQRAMYEGELQPPLRCAIQG